MTDKGKVFIDELVELCRKHKKALVPSYGGEISFHDSMLISDFDDDTERFIRESIDMGDMS